MAPLSKAIVIRPHPFDSTLLPPPADPSKETKLYAGSVDPEWTVGSVANGGYVLSLILDACIQHQSNTPHVDVLHTAAHFLRTTYTTPFTVCIRTVRVGSGFTNITADLIQEGSVKIMTHSIFGVNEPHPKDTLNLILNPPSTYARRHPLYTHPSQAISIPVPRVWKFHSRIKWTKEQEIREKNRADHPNRTTSTTVGGGGLEWGTWFELDGQDEKITTPSLAFLADIFMNTPTLLPESERPGFKSSWFPTMTMSIEFKNKIPPPSSKHSSRTVGIYSRGTFVTPPQGRHETHCEIWTAPSNIGEGELGDNWRDDQFCIAIATQMALMVPMEVNEKKGKGQSAKL